QLRSLAQTAVDLLPITCDAIEAIEVNSIVEDVDLVRGDAKFLEQQFAYRQRIGNHTSREPKDAAEHLSPKGRIPVHMSQIPLARENDRSSRQPGSGDAHQVGPQ